MIVELTIQNFKSFRDPTTISFLAGTSSTLSGNLLRHGNGQRVVKSMALYGSNASGKTTVLDGLYALGAFVLFSSQDQKPTSRITSFRPFALDRSFAEQPSRIALTIDLEVDRYTLDVSATAERVWKETLTIQHVTKQPARKAVPRVLIDRTWNAKQRRYSTTLHEDMGSALTRNAAIEQTTPNRLVLGKLASMNNEIARRIVEWFEVDLDFHDMHRNPNSEQGMLAKSANLLQKDADFAAMVADLVSDADTGVESLDVVEEKTMEAVVSATNEKVEFKTVTKRGLAFRHAAQDGSVVHFRRHQESAGTLRFVALLAAILQPGPRRRLICIDEFSASLHPDLVRRLIRIVHSRHNKFGNQLFFTTHDTHLMDPGELLRRDQITICEKDRFGRSTTRRLDEFQDTARSDANLQKQYLQGRFGGKPQFGPALEDVPVDDEPLEVNP